MVMRRLWSWFGGVTEPGRDLDGDPGVAAGDGMNFDGPGEGRPSGCGWLSKNLCRFLFGGVAAASSSSWDSLEKSNHWLGLVRQRLLLGFQAAHT